VLLADDNADMRDYVGRLLSQCWTVEAVGDGAAALAAARDHPPDLVLADVMMPALSGFELLRALRADARTATIPVLLLSARAGEESRVEGFEAGADDYLVKPFSARELIARVNAHLALAAERRRLLGLEQTARAEADAANRAKDRFLAVLSHELRTPLSSIIGWARILQNMQLRDSERAHAAGVIERSAQRQAQLINDLLDISRITAGKIDLDRAPVDLVTVTREAVDSLRADVDAKRLRLTTDLDPDTGEVFADPLRLHQVVLNLLTNAVKFTPDAGRIDVRLSRRGEMARLVVSDSGEGVAPAVLPYIFEPFRQEESGDTTRIHSGLGLGLTIVRQLVELHGGTVRAESAGKGTGTTFTVELPIVAVRVAPGSGDAGAPAVERLGRLDGLQVLVVDDQPDARDLVAFVLRQRGAETHTAESVAEALEILAAVPVDVLVSDLALPGVDGYALIAAVRAIERQQRGSAIRALALTAYAGHDVRDRAIAAGFDAHAMKPLDPDDLIELVARLSRA
jgi:signal transduction histidine kinase